MSSCLKTEMDGRFFVVRASIVMTLNPKSVPRQQPSKGRLNSAFKNVRHGP